MPAYKYKYWMVTDRLVKKGVPTGDVGPLSYWVSNNDAVTDLANWDSVPVNSFKTSLIGEADTFPSTLDGTAQKHVCFFVHGYNNGFEDAASRYQKICQSLFPDDSGLGICISLDWPSYGSLLRYLPDRNHAARCADDAASVFQALHDWLLIKQHDATKDAANACKAKVSVIAHSMGNYLMQKALTSVWKRINQPLAVSLIDQLVMVAADVDNDLFDAVADDATNGSAVANLTYRVTALYTGRDEVLGTSAGLKHFGTRRLGRSGLANRPPIESDGTKRDNVWDIDCSDFFPDAVSGIDVHGAYFDTPAVMKLFGAILSGADRTVLAKRGVTTSSNWKAAKG